MYSGADAAKPSVDPFVSISVPGAKMKCKLTSENASGDSADDTAGVVDGVRHGSGKNR